MENYIKTLDSLIGIKKDKNHKINRKESIAYAEAWKNLVSAEGGFTERVEQYFYNGFVYTGAKPFVEWVLATEEPTKSLELLFKGKRFERDNSATFRILINILAHLIISGGTQERYLIVQIMKSLPKVSRNKENKTIGDAHKSLTKYFIKELNCEITFPTLSELNINPGFIRNIVLLFDELLVKIEHENLSKKDKETIDAVIQWLHPESKKVDNMTLKTGIRDDVNDEKNGLQSTEMVGENHVPVSAIKITEKPEEGLRERVIEESQVMGGDDEGSETSFETRIEREKILENSTAAEESSQERYDQVKELLKQVDILTNKLWLEAAEDKKKAESEIAELRKETDKQTVQLQDNQQHIKKLQEALLDRTNTISAMSAQINGFSLEHEKLQMIINDREAEIAQRTQMIEALSRDRSKQLDEQTKRLASKLKVEYRDFKDAEGQMMDSDLGENMREQLKNIFAILIKAGISLD